MFRVYLIVLRSALVLGVTAGSSRAADESPTPEGVRFFETSVRPVLAEHCYRCHGPARQKAELRLDSRQGLLKGGATGPVVVAGQPEKSLLIGAIHHRDASLKMPPDKKLTDRQIADITRWVTMGMPSPQDRIVGQKDGPFWAFKPPADPPVPAVKDASWPRSHLDNFILATLEQKGLVPAPPAERHTLLRRVTFDLTGLPPTPEEADAFVKDASSDAFAKVVDRLLASRAYGERWGRHWLDVARYADSNGLDENVAHGNAWRYRDYVVAALNQDKPYNQFLLEQLAGDLLPATGAARRHELLIATGFLALGPKVLAEGDEKKMELDIIDEQIDTFGRALVGLTLGCARCHDHKFDPITTQDYHGLAGVFKSTRTMETFKRVARWYEHSIGTEEEKACKATHDRKVAQSKEAIEQLTRKANDKVKADAKPGTTLPKDLEPLYHVEVRIELKRLRDELARLEKISPEVPAAMGVTEGSVANVPVFIRGNHLKPGKLVNRQVPAVLAGKTLAVFDAKSSGRLEVARWLVRPDHPLTARVMVNRIWRWHFGRGIVPTPDNFGRLGEAPTNQALLDWLAHRFVENKWSIKAMHRMILLSNTYQMSAVADPKSALADPDNRHSGRANVKRLEAEAIRDNLLAVSGLLDRSMGGSLLHVKNRDYLFDHTSKDATQYDSRRRSLYLPVIRNNVYDVFQLFDFPDPAVSTGDRSTTTVAPQALFFMNSNWVGQLCEHWAQTLLKDANLDDTGHVRQLYRKAYCRPPTKQEVERSLGLVRGIEAALTSRVSNPGRRQLLAWASLCQTVVSANEFVYLQ